MLENGFTRGNVDKTLFTRNQTKHILIVQIYMDDIIFGATKESSCKEFSDLIKNEFEMSIMGELNFFLGLQIRQYKDGIFLNQSKYVKEMLKKFKLFDTKISRTPMSTTIKLNKDEKGK